MIEAIAVSGTSLLFLGILGATFYFSYVHAGLSYLLHENLVCQLAANQGNCRQEFLLKSKNFLFMGRLMEFSDSRDENSASAHVKIKMPLNQTMKIEKRLSL